MFRTWQRLFIEILSNLANIKYFSGGIIWRNRTAGKFEKELIFLVDKTLLVNVINYWMWVISPPFPPMFLIYLLHRIHKSAYYWVADKSTADDIEKHLDKNVKNLLKRQYNCLIKLKTFWQKYKLLIYNASLSPLFL